MSELPTKDPTCRKCGATMPRPSDIEWADAGFTLTGFRCEKCGHWNNLKARKGRRGEKC